MVEEKILISGRWSKQRKKWSRPRRKNLHLSTPQAAAVASPHIGAYLDSAPLQNLLPTNMVCHPVGQQLGFTTSHLHLFWVSHTPMPVLHQSVATAVGRAGSKDLTPASHCLTTSFLDSMNAASRSGDQEKGVLLLRRCLNGSMTGLLAKEYDTCATAPYQLLTSVRLVGVGKLIMLDRNSVVGLTPESVMVKPRKSTSDSANLNFFGFNIIPLFPQASRNWPAL